MNALIKRAVTVSALLISFAVLAGAQKQPVKPAGSASATKIGQFLKSSKYKVTMPEKDIWTVADDNFMAIVTTGDDYLIGFTVLARKGGYKATAESLSAMMKLSGELDLVKVVIDDSGDLILRLEAKAKSMDLKDFNEMIEQVFAATSEAVTRLSPHLVK